MSSRCLHGLTVCALVMLIAVPVCAGETPGPVASANTDSAMAYLNTLADPARFAGRKSGVETGTSSQQWIAAQFARWGLEPLIGGELLDPFPMLATVEKKGELELLDTDRYGDLEFLLGDDFTLTVNSGSGEVTAPVTVVGHGISKPDKGWDDYGEIDITGRIAVILRGRPDDKQRWDEEYSRTYLLNEAKRRGAAAVLFYMGEDATGGAAIMAEAYDPEIPSAIIGKRVIEHILYGTGFTLDIYERVLKRDPKPLALPKRMRIEAKVKRVEGATGYNVAGIVPGTDPALRGEAIVLGAHGDHVGTNAFGHVYPGADDNASGTSIVMELARAFAKHPQPRTFVFIIFGGEEQGLLGSKAIVPTLPDRYEYVTMVNLDMAGRGEGITGLGGGNQVHEVWFPWYESLPDSVAETISGRRAWGGSSSDHAPFRDAGIPAFTTYSRGSHDHYHSTDDRFKTIDTRAIGGALDAVGRWTAALASYPEPLASPTLAQRTIWHSGYPFRWHEPADLDSAAVAELERLTIHGYVAHVLRLPLSPADSGFAANLDRVRDLIEARRWLELGDGLAGVRGAAYNLRGTVFPAIDGDALASADTTRLEQWRALGLRWLTLDDPAAWVAGDSVRADRSALAGAIDELGFVVQLPLHHAHRWEALAASAGNELFVGSWDDLTGVSAATLETITGNGGHVLVLTGRSHLAAAAGALERVREYRIQLQPAGVDYEEALAWVADAQALGLERADLLDWIGGYLRRW
ncbi:MAG: Aminopeptidase YwaD [Calditrichaeota bacterium]|nr:Aminopeptidase YwaD [Calditrichota bacterium]